MVPSKSPAYGRRLIHSLIDQLAEDEPDGSWISVPISDNLKDGFKTITYGALANAVNRAARWIEFECGRSSCFETLPYLGPNDARYFILFAAAVKTGYKIFYPSPKNSLSGHLGLLEATKSQVLLYATSLHVQDILAHSSIRGLCVPELDDLLASDHVRTVPYKDSFEQAQHDPCLVLHTSGTTGNPKSIVLTHDSLATMDALWLVPPIDGRECFLKSMATNRRMYLAMPFFHMAGFSMTITLSLCTKSIVVIGPGNRPVSVPLVEDMLENADITSAMLPPSILEEMSMSKVALEKLSLLKSVYYGGASVSRAAGCAISQRTRLFNQIGSTESVVLVTHDTDPEDFDYFCFNSERNGLVFRETAETGLYEQFIVRNPTVAVHQGPFKILPHVQEYATKDLYSKHPTKSNHWLFQGRADDIIVFANGEKWNPCGAEAHIRKHPLIEMALITGQSRLQPAIIIELSECVSKSGNQRARVIEGIWPWIVEANSDSPAHGQIARSHMMLSKAGKPFQRTGKGTLRRFATLELYATEIDELYSEADSGTTHRGLGLIDMTDEIAVQSLIRGIFSTVTGKKDLAIDADFFNAGTTSLQVILAIQTLKSRFSPQDINFEALTPSLVYSHPCVKSLASFLCESTEENWRQVKAPNDSGQAHEMRRMIDKHYGYLPKQFSSRPYSSMIPSVIILTGSTGSLGPYLLETLIRRDTISRIYCLNRGSEGMKKQTEIHERKGLSADWTRKDIHFLQTDLSKQYFGMERKTYESLTSDVNVILHNQWQVDFNLILSSFEPQIRGLCNLIKFSTESVRRASIFFLSSISTVQNWGRHSIKVPEAFLSDLGLPIGGYGQSKAVASLLLEEANVKYGIDSTVVRVGQIAGPVRSLRGVWNQREWFPTLISTSKFLHCLPSDLGTMNTIDWVPVDIMADILVELMLLPGKAKNHSLIDKTMRMFHAVNPRTCQWQDLLPTVREHLGLSFPVVPLEEWVSRLQSSVTSVDTVTSHHPGINLVGFFQGLAANKRLGLQPVALETTETEKYSMTLRELKPVAAGWMKRWLKQWDLQPR